MTIAFHKIARLRFDPVGPYDFELTLRKPAGWTWSTPLAYLARRFKISVT